MQPIHFATMDGQLSIIQLLIDEYGVDPNSKNEVSVLNKYVGVWITSSISL